MKLCAGLFGAFIIVASACVASAQAPTPTPSGTPSIAEICPNVITVGKVGGKNILHKSQASGHLQSTGRSDSCTLIWGSGNYGYPFKRKLPIYDTLGGKLPNSFYAYELGGCPFPARFYTGVTRQSCKGLQDILRRRQGSREAYVKVSDTTCLRIKDLKGRQGSVLNSKPSCRKGVRYGFFGEG
jgi:hypothetical protein